MNEVPHQLSIYLDETGTPGSTEPGEPFIVGGFYTPADVGDVEADWESLKSNNPRLKRKSRRWPEELYLDVAEFMCQKGLIPVSTFTFLDEAGHDEVRQRVQEYMDNSHLRPPNTPERITPASFIWSWQAAATCLVAVTGQLSDRSNRIGTLRIHVDQFYLDPLLRQYSELVLADYLSPGTLQNFFGRRNKTPEFMAVLTKQTEGMQGPVVDWNMRGPLKDIADAVCTLQRKALDDSTEAHQALDILRVCFNLDKVSFSSVGVDLTDVLVEHASRPWPMPSEE